MATGVIVKPTKSYWYSNIPGIHNIHIQTCGEDGTFGLTKTSTTHMTRIKESDYWKHLGNRQSAGGHNPLNNTVMYDGSIEEGITTKITTSINKLRSRALTADGVIKAIKTVLIPQILYPTTFANVTGEDVAPMQKQLNSLLKVKLKLPHDSNADLLTCHEKMGGIGENTLQDLININRLMVLSNMLMGKGKVKQVMIGAIHRLARLCKTTSNPLSTKCITNVPLCHRTGWLVNLKQWMEDRDIKYTLPDLDDNMGEPPRCKGDTGIMDAYDAHSQHKRQQVWKWAHAHSISMLSDTIQQDFIARPGIWDSPQQRSQIYNNIVKKIKTLGEWDTRTAHRLIPGINVLNTAGSHGTIISTTSSRVVVRTRGRGLQRRWRKSKCVEITREYDTIIPITNTPITKHLEPLGVNLGLTRIHITPNIIIDVPALAQDSTQHIIGVSDGSVLDTSGEGTWGWGLWTYDKRDPNWKPCHIVGMGKETSRQLDTEDNHSYRIEAIGIPVLSLFWDYGWR
jgi:hypothetical protein